MLRKARRCQPIWATLTWTMGPNYLRYNGIMNPANGITNGPAAGSQGNAFPMFGTGNVIYTQIGYLLKKDLLGDVGHFDALCFTDECKFRSIKGSDECL